MMSCCWIFRKKLFFHFCNYIYTCSHHSRIGKILTKTLFYLICFKESGIFSIVFLSIVRISLNKSLILLVRDILILQWNICQQLILPLMRIWPIPDYFVHEFLFNDQREVDRSRGHMSLFTNTRQSCIVNVIF